MAWLGNNPSPLHFNAYHDMPKNLESFCKKFNPQDPQRTTEEHIKIFQIALKDMQINQEDVACRFFPYSLGEESFYWYINLPVRSITSWDLLMNAFLQKYKISISPSELYRQFMSVRREIDKLISSFNDWFHQAYTMLHAPYVLNDAATFPIYYVSLDNLTAALAFQDELTTFFQLHEKMESLAFNQRIKFQYHQGSPMEKINEVIIAFTDSFPN